MIDEKALREMAFAALRSVDCRVDKDTMPAAMEAIRLAYESAKPKEAQGWRDIVSAPKDGAPFLAVVWGQVRAIKWCAAWEVWFDDGIDVDTIDYENDDVFGIGALVPTHWRPLPEPPSAMLSAAGDGR